MNTTPLRPRGVRFSLARLVAVAAMAGVLTFSATSASQAAGMRAHEHGASAPALTAKATRFHDRMRALWEEHGPYIRHILDVADMISGGIVRQFPARFR